jgi:hypothetical protein
MDTNGHSTFKSDNWTWQWHKMGAVITDLEWANFRFSYVLTGPSLELMLGFTRFPHRQTFLNNNAVARKSAGALRFNKSVIETFACSWAVQQ